MPLRTQPQSHLSRVRPALRRGRGARARRPPARQSRRRGERARRATLDPGRAAPPPLLQPRGAERRGSRVAHAAQRAPDAEARRLPPRVVRATRSSAAPPTPASRYEFAVWRDAGVNIDYHVLVEHNYYSVPYQLVHQRVEVRLAATTVELFLKGRRIASHRRRGGRGQYATEPAHMPHAHRAHAEWTPSRLISWAETTGPATAALVAALLASQPHPEQGYRACLGLMRLSKTHGPARMDAACARALHLGAPSYRTVQNILASGADRIALPDASAPPPRLPSHPNIRGRAYYTGEETTPCLLTPPSTN